MTFPSHTQLSEDLEDLLCGLLEKDPRDRLGRHNGIRDILQHPWFKSINIGDVLEKKIDPPLKPRLLGFNFDEEEFIEGESEFRLKLLSSLEVGEKKPSQLFQSFFYDANIARLAKRVLKQQHSYQDSTRTTTVKKQSSTSEITLSSQ